jgi:tetratricopeptide (TPR) repeat protein
MIHDTPYTGLGLNAFPWVMDRFYPGFALGPEPHAHNLFLQTGVDLGLPGLVALAWLVVGYGLALVSVYRSSSDPATRAVALGLGAGLLAHLLFGTLDAVTLGAKPGILLWAMLGLGVALRQQPEPLAAWDRRLHAVPVLLLAAALLVPLAWEGPALNAGRALAQRALLAGSDTTAGGDPLLGAASELLERAARTDPGNSGTWYLLGSLAARTGDADRAAEALRRGARADSRDPLRRYSPAEALLEPEHGTDWPELLRTYAQWTSRYPRQAEWYVASAIALCEGQSDRPAALATLQRGLAAGAEPAALLHAYHASVTQRDGC